MSRFFLAGLDGLFILPSSTCLYQWEKNWEMISACTNQAVLQRNSFVFVFKQLELCSYSKVKLFIP
jgi:hypothetical protein